MAFLSEFGNVNYPEIFDYDYHVKAMNTLAGMQLFQMVEDIVDSSSMTIIGYEKSLFTKKQKGWVKLTFVQDAKVDISLYKPEREVKLPAYSDILLGFDCWSVYNSIRGEHYQTYDLAPSRKQVISYGMLMHCIQLQIDAYDQIGLDELKAGMFDSIKYKACSTGRSVLNKLAERLKVFDKYQQYSYQPLY